MTNEKFSMTNVRFRLNALVAACHAAPYAPGDFAFDSGPKNQAPSQSVAVSRSDSFDKILLPAFGQLPDTTAMI
jgi:hypothetical protein